MVTAVSSTTQRVLFSLCFAKASINTIELRYKLKLSLFTSFIYCDGKLRAFFVAKLFVKSRNKQKNSLILNSYFELDYI